MGFMNTIKNWFRRGGVAIGMTESLNSVLEHPKINGDAKEYARIDNSLMHYEGNYPQVEFTNSNKMKRKRDLSSINMMKKVANQYATMVFNEQCEINVGLADESEDGKDQEESEASKFITKVFEHNDFKKNFSKYLEPMFALGGLVCRPYYDADANRIEFSWGLADAFYPLQSNTNNISECAIPFVSTRTEGKKTIYYTLLEFHEWRDKKYVITNELYRSEEANKVGVKIPLSDLYEDLEEETIIEGLSRPLFAYLKTSGFNNINPYSSLGLGVCDNAKHTLNRINKTYDEFDQEVEKGKRKILVSEMLMNSKTNRETGQIEQFFDDEEDTFVIIPGANMDDMTVKDISVEIRTTEYIDTINHHLKTLEMETGLSTGTFTFDMNGVRSTKTATEVVSENSQTYQTRAMQITEIEKFVKELVISVFELAQVHELYVGEKPEFNDIGVSFDDGAFSSTDQKLTFYSKLVTLGYPTHKAFEEILKIPEDEALKLYKEGMRQQATKTTGMFIGEGFSEEDE